MDATVETDLSTLEIEGENVVEYSPVVAEEKHEIIETNKTAPTIEGFERELGIIDTVMDVRLKFIESNKESIINGALSGKDLEAANSMMSALTSEAMGKIKLVKDSAMAEAKQNSETMMLAMMSHLLTERTQNLQNYNGTQVSSVKLEPKKLDSFDLSEDEIKIKGD